MSKLNVSDYHHYDKNRCGAFYGVREHGSNDSYRLDRDSCDVYQTYDSEVYLNVYEDGYVCITGNHYDNRDECWVERPLYVPTDDEKRKILLDLMNDGWMEWAE